MGRLPEPVLRFKVSFNIDLNLRVFFFQKSRLILSRKEPFGIILKPSLLFAKCGHASSFKTWVETESTDFPGPLFVLNEATLDCGWSSLELYYNKHLIWKVERIKKDDDDGKIYRVCLPGKISVFSWLEIRFEMVQNLVFLICENMRLNVEVY